MNKEIIFRGKCVPDSKYAGEWVTGGYVPLSEDITPNNEGLIMRFLGGSTTITYHVDPDSVGQFTGLVDKKGYKIYDGDILFVEFADKSGGYQLVGWNEETASWGIMDAYSYQSIKEGYDFAEFKNHVLLAFLKDALICEVVGNIYDNSELLNKK